VFRRRAARWCRVGHWVCRSRSKYVISIIRSFIWQKMTYVGKIWTIS
jgi:hypothetical protein